MAIKATTCQTSSWKQNKNNPHHASSSNKPADVSESGPAGSCFRARFGMNEGGGISGVDAASGPGTFSTLGSSGVVVTWDASSIWATAA